MPENLDSQLDAAQSRLTELKEVKEKDKGAKTIEQFHKEIFTEVDELQAIEVNSPPATQELDRGKDEVNQWLLKIVQRGIDLKSNSSDLPESTADTQGPGPLATIEDFVRSLHNTTEAYSTNLLPAQEYEKSLAFAKAEQSKQTVSLDLPNLKPEQLNGVSTQLDASMSAYLVTKQQLASNPFLQRLYGPEELAKIDQAIMEIKNQQTALELIRFIPAEYSEFVTVQLQPKGSPNYVLTAKGKKLSPADQKSVLDFSLKVEDAVKGTIDKQVEVLSSPKELDHYWQGLALIEKGNLERGKKLLETFLEVDSKSYEYLTNPSIVAHQEVYEQTAKEKLQEAAETEQKNQKYFDGFKLIQSGNAQEGKKLLLAYVQEMDSQSIPETNPNAPKYIAASKEILKKIALLKVQEILAKMTMHEPPLVPTDSALGGGPQAGKDQTMVDPVFTRSLEALEQMETLIQSGLFLTYEEAYDIITVKGTDPPFDAEYTYLSDELKLEEGGEKSRKNLLELAKKYRYKNPALAEKYYTLYFAKQLAQTTKEITFESVKTSCTTGEHKSEFEGSLKALMERAKAEYKQQTEEFKAENPWKSDEDEYPKRLTEMLGNQAMETIYTQKIQEKQQEKFRTNPASISVDPGDQEAWAEYMDMKGMTHSGTWKSFLDPSDEQVWELITQLPVKIAIVAVSAKTAGLAGAALSRVAAATALGETTLAASTQLGIRLATTRLGQRYALSSTGSFLRNAAGLTIEGAVARAPFTIPGFLAEERIFSTQDTLMNAMYFDALQKGEFDPLKIYNNIPGWGHGVTGLGAFKGVGILNQLGKGAAIGSSVYKSSSALTQFGIRSGLETGAVGSQFVTTSALNKLHTGSGRLSTHDIAFVLGLHGSHFFGPKPEITTPKSRPTLQLIESNPSGPKTKFPIPDFEPQQGEPPAGRKTQPGEPLPEALVQAPKAPHPQEKFPGEIQTSDGKIERVTFQHNTNNPDTINVTFTDGRIVEMTKAEFKALEPTLEGRIKGGEVSAETSPELYKRLKANPSDPEALNALASKMRDPADLEVLQANLDTLTPEQFNLIVLVGSKIETVPSEDGKTETTYRIYSSNPFARGGMGTIADVLYVEGESKKLSDGVIKRPVIGREEFFEEDASTCHEVQKVLDANKHDPRTRHILRPSVIGKNFSIFPKLKNKDGKTVDLNTLSFSADAREMAEYWEGVAEGLDFLSEKGILAVDNKPANTMVGPEGGTIIDVGGFIFINRYKPGDPTSTIKIIDSKDFGETPVTVNQKTGKTTYLITTPKFTDRTIMTKEVKGELPPDQTNKLSLAMSIESYLSEQGHMGTKHIEKFGDPYNNRTGINEAKTGAGEPNPADYVDKGNIPPGKLTTNLAYAPKEIIQLYNLYIRLYESRNHPYEYKNNDSNQGKDPLYISLAQASKIFAQIARTP